MRSNDLRQYIELSTGEFSDEMSSMDEQVHVFAEVGDDRPEIIDLDGQIQESPTDATLYLKKGIALSRATLHHQQAIREFSYGLLLDPFNAQLYRWRGHKHLNVRELNEGCADLEMAVRLDPNDWDAWYHLGLGHYLSHDFDRAERAYRRCLEITGVSDNNKIIAITDWLYMTLMRNGKPDDANALLMNIPEDMEHEDSWAYRAYFNRLMLYKGLREPEQLIEGVDPSGAEFVTAGYGLGNYYFWKGDKSKAREIWETVVSGSFWSAFGYIGAEIELQGMDVADG
ncbi:MAG: tetratricopeptide repeat protein [Thermomicrobiales bacterium]|nr:tetratricopeptide repeat protein [Thermomicrobiales bacterium]MCO5228204.1 tetratricopeptide repeat protein [Thermomicrobiales bacterium]